MATKFRINRRNDCMVYWIYDLKSLWGKNEEKYIPENIRTGVRNEHNLGFMGDKNCIITMDISNEDLYIKLRKPLNDVKNIELILFTKGKRKDRKTIKIEEHITKPYYKKGYEYYSYLHYLGNGYFYSSSYKTFYILKNDLVANILNNLLLNLKNIINDLSSFIFIKEENKSIINLKEDKIPYIMGKISNLFGEYVLDKLTIMKNHYFEHLQIVLNIGQIVLNTGDYSFTIHINDEFCIRGYPEFFYKNLRLSEKDLFGMIYNSYTLVSFNCLYVPIFYYKNINNKEEFNKIHEAIFNYAKENIFKDEFEIEHYFKSILDYKKVYFNIYGKLRDTLFSRSFLEEEGQFYRMFFLTSGNEIEDYKNYCRVRIKKRNKYKRRKKK